MKRSVIVVLMFFLGLSAFGEYKLVFRNGTFLEVKNRPNFAESTIQVVMISGKRVVLAKRLLDIAATEKANLPQLSSDQAINPDWKNCENKKRDTALPPSHTTFKITDDTIKKRTAEIANEPKPTWNLPTSQMSAKEQLQKKSTDGANGKTNAEKPKGQNKLEAVADDMYYFVSIAVWARVELLKSMSNGERALNACITLRKLKSDKASLKECEKIYEGLGIQYKLTKTLDLEKQIDQMLDLYGPLCK